MIQQYSTKPTTKQYVVGFVPKDILVIQSDLTGLGMGSSTMTTNYPNSNTSPNFSPLMMKEKLVVSRARQKGQTYYLLSIESGTMLFTERWTLNAFKAIRFNTEQEAKDKAEELNLEEPLYFNSHLFL